MRLYVIGGVAGAIYGYHLQYGTYQQGVPFLLSAPQRAVVMGVIGAGIGGAVDFALYELS